MFVRVVPEGMAAARSADRSASRSPADGKVGDRSLSSHGGKTRESPRDSEGSPTAGSTGGHPLGVSVQVCGSAQIALTS